MRYRSASASASAAEGCRGVSVRLPSLPLLLPLPVPVLLLPVAAIAPPVTRTCFDASTAEKRKEHNKKRRTCKREVKIKALHRCHQSWLTHTPTSHFISLFHSPVPLHLQSGRCQHSAVSPSVWTASSQTARRLWPTGKEERRGMRRKREGEEEGREKGKGEEEEEEEEVVV